MIIFFVLIMFVLSNYEIKNQSPMRPVENHPLSNEKKLIKSDHSTMRETFSCKSCLKETSRILFLVNMTIVHVDMYAREVLSIRHTSLSHQRH